MTVRHAAFRLRPKNRNEEFERQKHVVGMLRAYMPDLEQSRVWWGASLSGVPLSPHLAMQAKRAGLEKGALDLGFIFPDGRSKYIEMKTPEGVLTREQAIVFQMLGPTRAVRCETWDGHLGVKPVIEAWLRSYGLRLLTDRESVAREGLRKQAEFAAKVAKARPLRRRAVRASP